MKKKKRTIKKEINVDRKSPLQCYAYEWLDSRGLFDSDADLGKAVFELVKFFSYQGHTGFSARMTKAWKSCFNLMFNQILKDFENKQSPDIRNKKVKNNNTGK